MSAEDAFASLIVVPEWHHQYIPYMLLRNQLDTLASSIPERAELTHTRSHRLRGLRPNRALLSDRPEAEPDLNATFREANLTYARLQSTTFAPYPTGTPPSTSLEAGADRAKAGQRPRLGLHVSATLSNAFEVEIREVQFRSGTSVQRRTVLGTKSDGGPDDHEALNTSFCLEEPEGSAAVFGVTSRHANPSMSGAIGSFSPSPPRGGVEGGARSPPPSLGMAPRKAMAGHGMVRPTRQDFAIYEASVRVSAIVQVLRQVNRIAMEELRGHIDRTGAFYEAQATTISAAAVTALDLCCRHATLSRREQDKVATTLRMAMYSLHMLQEFCDHNYFIVARLLDDLSEATRQDIDTGAVLESLVFFSAPRTGPIALLRESIEERYAELAHGGSRDAALDELRMKEESAAATVSPAQAFAVGAELGFVLTMLLVCSIMYFEEVLRVIDRLYNSNSDAYFFSISGIVILLAVAFSVNVVIWERFRINYVFSLHLSPLTHRSGLSMLRENLLYGVTWFVCLYGFLHAATEESEIQLELDALTAANNDIASRLANASASSSPSSSTSCWQQNINASTTGAYLEQFVNFERQNFHSFVWAYLTVPLCLGLFVALHWRRWRERRDLWLLRTLGRILVTPYYPVEFPDFFICEQLETLATTFFEAQFIWCKFHADSVREVCDAAMGMQLWPLLVLPSVWRVLQSLRRFRDEPHARSFYPHLLNALKYSINVVAYTLLALKSSNLFAKGSASADAVFALYIASNVIVTLYKCGYEVYVEFGCFPRHGSRRQWPLRDILLLPRWVYYFGIAENVLLRCVWVAKYFASKYYPTAQWVFPVFAVLEVFRRFMWNLLRVENDQVTNTESYKLVKLAPSVHVAASRAPWELHAADLHEQLPLDAEGREALDAMLHTADFFRRLSRQERIGVVQMVQATTPGRMDSPANRKPPTVQNSDNDDDDVLLNTHVDVGASTLNSRQMFLRDPRSGLRKTAVMLFAELHAEDRARGFLLRVGAHRRFSEYVDDLLEEGELFMPAGCGGNELGGPGGITRGLRVAAMLRGGGGISTDPSPERPDADLPSSTLVLPVYSMGSGRVQGLREALSEIAAQSTTDLSGTQQQQSTGLVAAEDAGGEDFPVVPPRSRNNSSHRRSMRRSRNVLGEDFNPIHSLQQSNPHTQD